MAGQPAHRVAAGRSHASDEAVEHGLHERAETVGGWVDISSNPQGTSLILSVPLSGDENGFIDALLTGLPDDTGMMDNDHDDPTTWGNL